MKDKKTFLDVEPEDFAIRLHPKLDKNNKWTGEVVVGIVTSESSKLDDHDYSGMLQFTNMLCSCVPMMEEDLEFREAVIEYYESELVKVDIPVPKVTKEPNTNIIRLHFNTKIDGSA